MSVSTEPHDAESFLDNILTPGSSLHPTFLVIVDGSFILLLLILTSLAILTSGNIHVLVLMAIELCLWASVKWCILVIFTLYIDTMTVSIISEPQVCCRAACSKRTPTRTTRDSAGQKDAMKKVRSLLCVLALFIPPFCGFSTLLSHRKY
jgi:hypothetical protein